MSKKIHHCSAAAAQPATPTARVPPYSLAAPLDIYSSLNEDQSSTSLSEDIIVDNLLPFGSFVKFLGCSLSFDAAPLNIYSSLSEDQSSTSLSEDIIVGEILLRLPVKLLFQFKCISKRYKSIISDQKFAQYYMQRAYSSYESWSSSGLFSSLLFPFTGLPPCKDIMDLNYNINNSVDQRSICLSSISLRHDHQSHTILGSSNGLILSVFHPGTLKLFKFGLCISNPLTKQCVQLPDSTLTRFVELEFGISTRHDKAASAFLTYKIVIIRCVSGHVLPHNHTNTTVEIFSSDTGSWVARELCCPRRVLDHTTCRAHVTYRGILHWLDRQMGTVITYDPFDSPDRFGHIQLPNGDYSDSCLIYSGDQEMLKYCGIDLDPLSSRVVDTLSVWRLVDSDKGEWCLERKVEVKCLHHPCMMLMVAPNHWNRQLICHPFLKNKCFTVINLRNGRWIFQLVFLGSNHASTFRVSGYRYPLIPIELCPWSSPFYAQTLAA